ncbi:porin family protein [Chitinophaga sp. GCM10012297]|uniref:PorT family protein n=1 Tax=Chitinophaga chungangae TaxID=2821488 RepID=A0ABS3YL65_9BACT|nr:porin family protein [Chitinophaga chungangae]MBO9155415.1 PorT family protein [Chitinophaga chungangae]
MKKLFFALAVITCVTVSTANAQKLLRFGIKGGANLGKIDGTGYDDAFKLGYHLGGFAQINLMKGFGIQPELIFSSTKTEVTSEFEDVYNIDQLKEDKPKLNYLSIPVLANIDLGSPRFKLQVGPQFGIMTSKKTSVFEEGKSAFKSGEFSAVGGLWLQLPIVNISARYVIGISDVNDVTFENTTSPEKWRNQSIQLGVGITL